MNAGKNQRLIQGSPLTRGTIFTFGPKIEIEYILRFCLLDCSK